MIITLTQEELAQAVEWGKARSRIMAKSWDKAGYTKRGGYHTNEENDILGVVTEIAACILLGADMYNPLHYTAVEELVNGRLPDSCKRPDVFGRYEIRRVELAPTPIKIYRKDVEADAVVIQGLAHHKCMRGAVEPTGRVDFLGWTMAALAWKPERVDRFGVHYTPIKKPMAQLAMAAPRRVAV